MLEKASNKKRLGSDRLEKHERKSQNKKYIYNGHKVRKEKNSNKETSEIIPSLKENSY